MSTTFSLQEKERSATLQRHFALCNSCFWSATVLGPNYIDKCPACPSRPTLSIIPLNLDEMYSIAINSKGIEMAFDKLK
jgi:hypothetical protein